MRWVGPFMKVFHNMHGRNPNRPTGYDPAMITEPAWLQMAGRGERIITGRWKPDFPGIHLDFAKMHEKIMNDAKRIKDMLIDAQNKRMNRKPFKLSDTAGRKVITSEGHVVEQIKQFQNTNGPYNIFGVCNGAIINFNEAGIQKGHCSPSIFLEAVKKRVWINIYKQTDAPGLLKPYTKSGAGIYATEEEARKNVRNEYPYTHIATSPIDWYE